MSLKRVSLVVCLPSKQRVLPGEQTSVLCLLFPMDLPFARSQHRSVPGALTSSC